MDRTKRRNPIISFLLSFVMPGLGHVYNGQLLKGILFLVGFWVLFFALAFSGLILSLRGLICVIAAVAVCPILIATHAAIEASRLKEARLKWYNKWYVYVCAPLLVNLALEAAAPFAGRHLAGVRSFKIPSSNMSPTLENGDHFIAKLEKYGDRVPRRGDIIVFPYPEDRSVSFVKRVIGLPGERIEIKDKVVFINDQRLADPWGEYKGKVTFPSDVNPRDSFGPVDIPEGAVFVLGDNRDNSFDSRFWGHVETKDIEGKAVFIYWSNDRNRIGTQLD
jgi:signal peptidase I